MKSRAAFFLSSFFVCLSVSASSFAAEKSDPPPEDTAKHLSGLEVVVRPTLGGAGADSPLLVAPGARVVGDIPSVLRAGSSPYGMSFGAGAMLGYRFHPLVSAGLRGDFGSVSASDPSDGTKSLSRDWQSAGLYVRAYPLAWHEGVRKYIDPWVSAGVTYVHDRQGFTRPAGTNAGTTVNADWQLDSHSIGVPLGIGIDYRVTRAVSVGPSFEYVVMNPIAGCAKQSASGFQANRMCTDNEGGSALLAQASGAWNLGLAIRLTPF